MSTRLADFLRHKAEQYAAESQENRQIIEEWQSAVERLFAQLEHWVRTADPGGIIQCDRSSIEVMEPGLGRYPVSRLDFRAFGKWVGVIPKARKTIKRAAPHQPNASQQATGRVDITDELRRFVLYRIPEGGREQWYLDDTTASDRELQPLSQEAFESALLSYFQ